MKDMCLTEWEIWKVEEMKGMFDRKKKKRNTLNFFKENIANELM